ncbi:MAG: hypothetical protein C5B58_13315 [Acidobacteria bacterium]|nr:MAG: hypothetical protein C5B58_13315 [Acidobacteriota bacterium]
MKLILPFVVAALGFSTSIVRAQEQPLTSWPTQDGQNIQVGQLSCPLPVQGLNIRDSSGNLTSSSTPTIPLLTDPASVGATTQIGDTLYALIPPDGSNQATAVIMYQGSSSTSDEINKAVQDALNHNNWFNATFTVRNVNPGETLPDGTEFWVCSSTGFVTFTDTNNGISVAGPPVPAVDPTDPAITGLQALTSSTPTSP